MKKKLRPREVKWLDHGHTAGYWQRLPRPCSYLLCIELRNGPRKWATENLGEQNLIEFCWNRRFSHSCLSLICQILIKSQATFLPQSWFSLETYESRLSPYAEEDGKTMLLGKVHMIREQSAVSLLFKGVLFLLNYLAAFWKAEPKGEGIQV